MATINLGSRPVGSMVRAGKIDGNDIIWLVGAKNHSGYPENSVSLIARDALRPMPLDGKEPNNADVNRKNHGNNYYTKSNLHQWLNKGGQPWYVAQHVTDAPPSANNVAGGAFEHEDGFLNCLPVALRAKLLDTKLVVAKPALDGGGAENITAKAFLLSMAEVAGQSTGGTTEGVQWPLFNLDNDRIALDFNNTAQDWWLRSACMADYTLPANEDYMAHSTRRNINTYRWESGSNGTLARASVTASVTKNGVSRTYAVTNRRVYTTDTSGTISVFRNDYYCSYDLNLMSRGATPYLRPAINLPADLKLTAEPGADGVYDIIYNTEPAISGANLNKGLQQAPFDYTYTVTDPDEGQTVTVTEELVSGSQTRTLRTFEAAQGQTYTAALAQNWLYAQNGDNRLHITADDGEGGVSTRTVSFSRKIDHIAASRAFSTDDLVTECIFFPYPQNQPTASEIVVEATNNPFDTAPVWEDITGKLGKYAHIFANATAAKGFGLGYRFKITPSTPGGRVFFDSMNIRFKTEEGV